MSSAMKLWQYQPTIEKQFCIRPERKPAKHLPVVSISAQLLMYIRILCAKSIAVFDKIKQNVG
jgi:hypothetical protein